MRDAGLPALPRAGVPERLRALAYERESTAVFRDWLQLERPARQAALSDPDILLAVVTRAAQLIGQQLTSSEARASRFSRVMQLAIESAADDRRREGKEHPVEWFQALERWSAAAVEHFQFDIAERALTLAFDTGAQRFPGVFQALRASEAELAAKSGQVAKAAELALWYSQRPYLLPERRRLPQIYPRLTAALLLAGRVAEYRQVLWRGLRESYASVESRDWFADKIRHTYRGRFRALLHSGGRPGDRLQLLFHWFQRAIGTAAPLRFLRVDRFAFWMSSALGYALSGRDSRRFAHGDASAQMDAILVTRAMGGIGDLLMMTPGLCALKRQHPRAEIHFAVPRQYFALFEGIEDFRCIDIDDARLDPMRYRAWFDLTDCPAARVESRQAPNVRTGRIEAFARMLGVSRRLLQGAAARPRYVVAPGERRVAEERASRLRRRRRGLVGLQWQSAESYRNYPYNLQLLELLSQQCDVVVFGAGERRDSGKANVHFVTLPLREAFALAAQCDVLVGPDSSFVHLAGALEKQMVLIAGPIDGRLRAKPYRTVVPIVPDRREFPCAPCWRNENINCYLSGRRESVCLRSISPAAVVAQIVALLPTHARASEDGPVGAQSERRTTEAATVG